MTGRTLSSEGAAEEIGDLATDGQPQSCTSVLATGGAVRLLESPEDGFQLLLGDTDAGVLHPEGYDCASAVDGVGELAIGCWFDAQFHAAAFGELDRVGKQVAQDLPEPGVVREQVDRYPGRRCDGEVETLLRGHRLERRLDVVEELLQRDALRIEVHLVGLDLRQVEDVVDQLEQVAPGRVDDARVLDLLGREVAGRILGEQLGEDEQTVEWGPQFMTHVRQEFRLVRGRQRQLLGTVLELLPGLLDLQVLALDVAVLRCQQGGLLLQLRIGTLQFLLLHL